MSIMMNGKMIAGGGVKPYKDETFFRTGTVAYNVTPNGIDWYEALVDTKGDGLTSNKWKLLPDTPALGEFLNEGEVLTDKEGLAEVNKYAHSTFDRSKFTVVGSPNITDDGIASGFSTSNYLRKDISANLTTQTLIIDATCIYEGGCRPLYTNTDYWRIRVELSSTSVAIRFSDSTVISISNLSIQNGDKLRFKLKLSNSGNELTVWQNGIQTGHITSSYTSTENNYNNITSIALGGCYNAQGYANVKLDLKQFSITVDGVEVFNGNKTGIDTIKPVNLTYRTTLYAYKYDTHTIYADYPTDTYLLPTTLYNSNGSLYTGNDWHISEGVVYYGDNAATYTYQSNINDVPSPCDASAKISDDGILYKMKRSQNVLMQLDYFMNKKFKIKFSFKLRSWSNSAVFTIFGNSTAWNNGFCFRRKDNSEAFTINWFGLNTNNNNSLGVIYDNYLTGTFLLNTKYYVEIAYDGISKYTFKMGTDKNNLTTYVNADKPNIIMEDTTNLRQWKFNSARGVKYDTSMDGEYDLNDIEFYVNDELYYQPCLKIPYTESSERYNCKVVDDIYRDRVIDCYNQGYKNTYYTLGDSDYTLPMGNIFTMIEDREKISNRTNVITEESTTQYPTAKAVQDKLHPLKGYIDEGEILTDKEGYTDLLEMAHSTFDLSKFAVVGSPKITDDGVASGFSGSGQGYNGNTLYVDNFGSLLSNAKTYEIEFEVDLKEISTSSGIISCHDGWSEIFDFNFNSCNNSEIKISFGNWFLDSDNQVVTKSSGFIDIMPLGFALNDRVIFKQVVTETALTSFVKKIDNINWVQVGSTIDLTGLSILNYPNANLHIGFTPNWNKPSLQPIDLKYISLKVDGVEVFSGNKTGIDTIKPDDYTVVGTPTISDDGIVSGFSNNDYIKTASSSIDVTKPFKIICPFEYKSTATTGQQVIFQFDKTYKWTDACIFNSSLQKLAYFLALGASSTNVATFSSPELSYGKYTIIFEWTGTEYIFTVLDKNNTQIYRDTFTSSEIIHQRNDVISCLYLGKCITNDAFPPFSAGSIDLNAFKIYVDGNLVYQSCLKIPYTETEGGSKVVNQIYLDRVKDAYEQNYKDYKYFTIDEENKTYSLPMGNIYDNLSSNTRDIVGLKDLTNISEKGDDRLHALKCYAEEGELLTDNEAFLDIQKYKDSSFDPSKFTVVGSPIVTSDGIASGFRMRSFLYCPTFNATANIFEIKGKFQINKKTSSTVETIFGELVVSDWHLRGVTLRINDGIWLELRVGNGESSIAKTSNASTYPISIDTDYYFKVTGDSSYYKLFLSTDGVTYSEAISLENTLSRNITSTTVMQIGAADGNNMYAVNTTIDLKQFSITVDGVEVFNGHQEGIDVLKPNDFTTVTTIYAYTFNSKTVYSNVADNNNPTELYNSDGSYYANNEFQIINDVVTYPEQATRGNDDVTIGGVTYYEFEHNTSSIYTNNVTTPTALFNSDGSTYTGTLWNIMHNKIYYLNVATYTSASNITINREYNTVDAGVKITDDGIVSNFNADRYLWAPSDTIFNITNTDSWMVSGDFTTGNTLSVQQYVVTLQDVDGAYSSGITFDSSGAGLRANAEDTDGSLLSATDGHTQVLTNTRYKYMLMYDSTVGYKFYCSKFDDELSLVAESSNNRKLNYGDTRLRIGRTGNYSPRPFLGSLDLNLVKLYRNYSLVYQPMLKIPYIQSASKYGSKIVEEEYRNRVEDAYEQGFEQKYFTLDEEKQNFTLPLGELYGLIESKVPKSSLQEVICIIEDYTFSDANAFCWDLSNGWRIQGASQTVTTTGAVEVPLLKNFANANYLAFKNYGAGVSTALQDYEGSIYNKTANSFETYNTSADTSKFDWIAIGKIG